jgi:glutamyl-tRNA synthetase
VNLLITDIERFVYKNAITHDGKAEVKSVVNKMIGSDPELRKSIKTLMVEIIETVDRVNTLSLEEQKDIALKKFPEILMEEKKNEEHRLPELKNVHGPVVMRMAPSPSGPLHLGHSRMCILNDEYVKRYGGELILRIEDTNPGNIYPQAYEMIREDVNWLGVNFTQFIIQSERMELYYERARELIKMKMAYICQCKVEDFKKDLMNSMACPHRDVSPEENLELFNEIIIGKIKDLSPVLVIKTDLNHPNPAVRDWIAFRVSEIPHPHTGTKYRFYPLMNFSVAIDDHELGLTNVIRGSDHLNNTERQKYIFNYFKWKIPDYFHYGLINIQDTILSTSTMRKAIDSGEFVGWDDIRLGTLLALRKRGYQKETFRKYWIDSGLNDVNSEFSWEIFNSINRQFIDPFADRYFFVTNPTKINIKGAPEALAKLHKYPNKPERGYREYRIPHDPDIFVQESDLLEVKDGDILRLKDLYNIKFQDGEWLFDSVEMKGIKRKIIHWVDSSAKEFQVIKPDGTKDQGMVEKQAENANGIVQFERYSFVNKISPTMALYLHK